MIREFDKWILREEFGGDLSAMEEAGEYIDWTQERIRKSFNFGLGTERDLREYIRTHREYSIFKELPV